MLKKQKYIGFNNDVCECEYLVGTVGNDQVLIIKQLDLQYTSITNCIETIVSSLLAGDLFGSDPASMRIFEFYPKSLEPLIGWQAVHFGDSGKRQPRMSFLEKIKDYFSPTEQPYYVDKPSWNPITPEYQAKLVALAPQQLI